MLLVEMWTLKVLWMRLQKAMRNLVLETGRKMILVVQGQKVQLNCVLQLSRKQKLKTMNFDIQLRRFPSKVLKVWPIFFLIAYNKQEMKETGLMEQLLSKKKPRLDDFGNSQPLQIAKDDKIGKFAFWKACSGQKPKGVADGFSFASDSERTKGHCRILSHTEPLEEIRDVVMDPVSLSKGAKNKDVITQKDLRWSL